MKEKIMPTNTRNLPDAKDLAPKIAHLESAFESLAQGQREMRGTIADIYDKVNALVTAVTSVQSRRTTNVAEVLSVTQNVLTIGALCAGLIIYIATNITGASQLKSAVDLARHEERLSFQSERLDRIEKALHSALEQSNRFAVARQTRTD